MRFHPRRNIVFSALLLATSGIGAARADDLSCQLLPELFRAYLSYHYSAHTLSDEIKNHTVEQYLKTLDPTKSMLLEEDVVRLRKQLPEVFNTMRSGDCAALDDVQKLIVQRAEENEAFARKFLGPDYKLDENIEIVTDLEKRKYPRATADREDLERKLIHFQISNLIMTDVALAEAKKQLVHRYELATKRVKERTKDDTLSTFADAFANALDPHSSFFSKDRLEEFRIEMSLSLEGIGASLSSQDGYTVIEEIIPGGAADRSKLLKPKDKIIAVAHDGEKPASVIDMDLRDVVKMIRGKKGTKVTLTILRQGETVDRFEATIVRDKISMKDQEAKIRYETRKVDDGKKSIKLGIIDLPSFYGEGEKGKRSCYTDVQKLLAEAKKQKVDGLVLDLSRNGGGLLEDAVKMSGLFIKTGGIVATQSSRKKVDVLSDEDDETAYSGPLVVLTSRVSASASEILAGALKDYKRALIVGGDHTFGKGTVQAVMPLRDMGALKVTQGMFFLPGGTSTQHQGVAADIALPSALSTDDIGEKALDYSLPPNKIDAFLSPAANAPQPGAHWTPVDAALVRKLADRSLARVAKDKKFAEIRKEIEETKKNKGVIRLAEVRKKTKANKKKDKAEEKKTAAQRIRDIEKPYVNESLNILSDYVELSPAPAAATAQK